MKLTEQHIGPEAEFELKFENGRLILTTTYTGQEGGAKLELYLKPDALIDQLAAAIPGKLDDAILATLKAALS